MNGFAPSVVAHSCRTIGSRRQRRRSSPRSGDFPRIAEGPPGSRPCTLLVAMQVEGDALYWLQRSFPRLARRSRIGWLEAVELRPDNHQPACPTARALATDGAVIGHSGSGKVRIRDPSDDTYERGSGRSERDPASRPSRARPPRGARSAIQQGDRSSTLRSPVLRAGSPRHIAALVHSLVAET